MPEVPLVTVDPSAIKQVVLNLLKNAADALEETGGTVRIRVASSPDGRSVEVSVADNGPGIDAELRSRIFEPFFTTKPAGRGTGLGLAICRRIAESHRGTLEVDAAAGGGRRRSRFACRRRRRMPQRIGPRIERLLDYREYPILFVDDEIENTRIFELDLPPRLPDPRRAKRGRGAADPARAPRCGGALRPPHGRA